MPEQNRGETGVVDKETVQTDERKSFAGRNGGTLLSPLLKGQRVVGRQRGSQNKFTRQIKEGLVEAAILYGYDGKGKNEMIGFFHRVIEKDIAVFCGMLSRAMPLQIHHKGEGTTILDVTYYESSDEIREEMKRRGLPDNVTIYGSDEVSREAQEDACRDENDLTPTIDEET